MLAAHILQLEHLTVIIESIHLLLIILISIISVSYTHLDVYKRQDQVFKYPEWSHDLRACYEMFPTLKIIFTGSSVMRLKEENTELSGIVKV